MIEIKVAVLDDNVNDQERVKNYFDKISNSTIQYICTYFSNENEEFYNKHDVYFIDIELGKINGLDIAEKVKKVNNDAVLIIYSKHKDLVFETFKYGAFFFIRKESFIQDMEYCQMRLNEYFLSSKREYIYRFNQTILHIDYLDILFIEKMKHHIVLHLKDGRVLEEYKSLKQIINDLNHPVFMQCHQSYVVNLNNIDTLSNNDFIIHGKKVQISRRYLKSSKKEYLTYLNKKV